MLSLQSQLCAIRGAFHLCFKRNEQKKNKFRGLKVFLTMLVLSLHNPQTGGALRVCSSLPSTAQLLLPTTWRRQFQSTEEMGGRRWSLCVFVYRGGMTEIHNNPPKKTKKGRESQGGWCLCMCVCLCVPWKINKQPKCTFASPENPLSASFQDEIQTNLLIFPHLFLNRCCFADFFFILLYKICRKRQKKIHYFFLQTN